MQTSYIQLIDLCGDRLPYAYSSDVSCVFDCINDANEIMDTIRTADGLLEIREGDTSNGLQYADANSTQRDSENTHSVYDCTKCIRS